MLLMGPHREVRGNLEAPRRELIGSCKRMGAPTLVGFRAHEVTRQLIGERSSGTPEKQLRELLGS